ncbi:uncharacterized protein LOC9652809 isoform X1 [Selaginella moellendorffii]|uniref:uncharacterized protein LOC9652809 isoform X1 n=1 Tax=Selaginella moellendorffii TaxID=88036 RepID=UPI000D1C5D48|nr:uncharacterized protein LOC9652809 isoform X1 [Selaginella moellendorffii]|eukprot:XP_024526911.1 uncharacterized protein LOC9652809 isoform X1 [Selaginella moellendorffii]
MGTNGRSHRSPRRLSMIHEEATKLEKDTIKLEKEAKDKETKLASIRAALAMEHRVREDISKEAKSKGSWWHSPQRSKCSDLLSRSRSSTKPLHELKTIRSGSSCSLSASETLLPLCIYISNLCSFPETTTTENELMSRICQDMTIDQDYDLDSTRYNSSLKRASNMLLSSFGSDTSFEGTKLSQSSSSARGTPVDLSPRRDRFPVEEQLSQSSSMLTDDPRCMGIQTDHFCPPSVMENTAAPLPPKREKTYFEHVSFLSSFGFKFVFVLAARCASSHDSQEIPVRNKHLIIRKRQQQFCTYLEDFDPGQSKPPFKCSLYRSM